LAEATWRPSGKERNAGGSQALASDEVKLELRNSSALIGSIRPSSQKKVLLLLHIQMK
jgi:hypothetical protein